MGRAGSKDVSGSAGNRVGGWRFRRWRGLAGNRCRRARKSEKKEEGRGLTGAGEAPLSS